MEENKLSSIEQLTAARENICSQTETVVANVQLCLHDPNADVESLKQVIGVLLTLVVSMKDCLNAFLSFPGEVNGGEE